MKKVVNHLFKKPKFTLIELIVVIVILGILAAIVVPNISSWQKEAEFTAVKSNLRNLQTSADMYALDSNGNLPGTAIPKELIPVPIDFEKITPSHNRTLPKTKGIKYWVDVEGKVWASTIDSPTNVDYQETSNKLIWDSIKDAEGYNIYEVTNYKDLRGSINSNSKFKLVKEVTQFTPSEDGKIEVSVNKANYYAVSAVDTEGFETPPVGSEYKGFDFYLSTQQPSNPTPVVPIFESKVDLKQFNKVSYVDSINGNDSNSGSKETPFKTIQKAIDNTTTGGAVYISEGVYSDFSSGDAYVTANMVVKNKNLSFIGEGKNTVIKIKAENLSQSNRRHALYIQDSKINIYNMNFEFEGVNTGIMHWYGFMVSNVGNEDFLSSLDVYNSSIISKTENSHMHLIMIFDTFQHINFHQSIIDLSNDSDIEGYFYVQPSPITFINSAVKENTPINSVTSWDGNSMNHTQVKWNNSLYNNFTYDQDYKITSTNGFGIGAYSGTYSW